MSETVATLAQQARRAGVVAAVRDLPRITLGELSQAMNADGPYAEILRTITVAELQDPGTTTPCWRMRNGEPELPKDTILRIFRNNPSHVYASGFFVELLGLPRWTVTALLGELVEAGQIDRRGRAGATRYRFSTEESSSDRSRGRAKPGVAE